jgi:hypothetical protein
MSHDAIDQAIDILEKNSEASDKNQVKRHGKHYDDEKDQPQHFSWVHIDVEAPGCCTDTSSCIMYGDAEEMQQQFLDYARHMVTPELLQMLRDRKLVHITLRIGPRSLSGIDLNDDYGIEVKYEQ